MKRNVARNVRELDIEREIQGVRAGKVVEINEDGRVMVDYPGNTHGPVHSKFTHSIQAQLENRSVEGVPVLLAFENNDPASPVIIDFLFEDIEEAEAYSHILEVDKADDVEMDGERLNFSAEKEIVLSCGESSITLTRAGKVIIRGAYLLNRSSGVNMIKGASVRIN